MNILLTGIDGYAGWPVALGLSREFSEARIIGVDNLARRKWVEECGSISAIPIESMEVRLETARKQDYKNISFIKGDLRDRDFVYNLIEMYRPEVIVHFAAQPSAPYSQISGERASYTQFNNNESTRNLLWAIKEKRLTMDTHFIETTTTGVYGTPEFEIPEGFIEVERKGKKDILPFPLTAGSWYHMSKTHDVNNLFLANKLWKLTITDLRMAIVFGTDTEDTKKDPCLATRFDFDYYFGVVGNRFAAMATSGYPLMIYGKGEQRKPQVSLQDVVQSTVNAVKKELNGNMEIFNQTLGAVSILELAMGIQKGASELGEKVDLKHIPNPRVEKEEHKMEIDNGKFLKLLGKKPDSVEEGLKEVMSVLQSYKETIISYKDRFLPEEFK